MEGRTPLGGGVQPPAKKPWDDDVALQQMPVARPFRMDDAPWDAPEYVEDQRRSSPIERAGLLHGHTAFDSLQEESPIMAQPRGAGLLTAPPPPVPLPMEEPTSFVDEHGVIRGSIEAVRRGVESVRSSKRVGRASAGIDPDTFGYVEEIPAAVKSIADSSGKLISGKAAVFSWLDDEQRKRLDEEVRRYIAVQKRNESNPIVNSKSGFFKRGWFAGLQSVSGWITNMVGGLDEAATTGALWAGAALVAGQLGPQAALPEEFATVPSAFLAGFTKGLTAGTAKEWYFQGLGDSYTAMVRAGIDREAARSVSTVMALPYAAIEYLSGFLPGIGGVVKVGEGYVRKMAAAQTMRAVLKGMFFRTVFNAPVEMLEEGLQSANNDIAHNWAAKISNAEAGTDVDKKSFSDILNQSWREFYESTIPVLMMGFGGAAVSAPGNVKQANAFRSFRENMPPAMRDNGVRESIVGQLANSIDVQDWAEIYDENRADIDADVAIERNFAGYSAKAVAEVLDGLNKKYEKEASALNTAGMAPKDAIRAIVNATRPAQEQAHERSTQPAEQAGEAGTVGQEPSRSTNFTDELSGDAAKAATAADENASDLLAIADAMGQEIDNLLAQESQPAAEETVVNDMQPKVPPFGQLSEAAVGSRPVDPPSAIEAELSALPDEAAIRAMNREQARAQAKAEGVRGPNRGAKDSVDEWAGFGAKDIQDRILKARNAPKTPLPNTVEVAPMEDPRASGESVAAQGGKDSKAEQAPSATPSAPDAAQGRPAGEGMASYAEGLRRMTDKELRAEEKRLEDAINNRDQHDYFDVSAKLLELSREQENRKSGIYLTQQQYFDRWLKDRIAAKDRAEFLSDAGRVAGIREQTDSNHRAAVEWALSRGRFVPANVLAEYPDLSAPAAQAKPAEVATPEATEKAPAEPPKAATGEQTVTSPPLRIPSHQPSDSGAVDKSASEPIPKQKSKPSPLRKGDHVLFKGEEYYISAFPRLLRRQGRVEITLVGGEKTATPLLKDLIPAGERAAPEKIEDFGEKIGGARKDTAERGYTMTKNRDDKADAVPTWRKKYVILKKVDGSGWSIAKKDDKLGNIMVGNRGQTFATEAEAEAAIPLVAVAQNYVARQNKGKKWEIYKRVGKRKLLKVVNREFDSREEATKHMALNAVDLLNLKTSFGEEILPAPDVVRRVGPERRKGNVTPEMFMETFAPRGIEFGNWNNQEERQAVMNHAYDALLDLAEVLDVPPKALMLDGDLAIAFGARGHGLSGAKAHYELDYGVINLTKMSGAGSLAHEWMHALDHYLARLDSKAPSGREKNKRGDMVYPARSNKYTFQSRGYSFRSKMREELKKAYQDLVWSLMRKAEKYVEDTTVADKFLWQAKEELRNALNNVRTALASDLTPRHKSRGGWSGKPIKHLRPASAEQLAEFDRLADILVEGGSLESKFYPNESTKKGLSGRQSNETLEAISGILKAARGRSGFLGNRNGPLDRVRYAMAVYSQRIKTLDSAKTGEQQKRTVATNYAIEARKMDQTRVGDYWSEPHEMVARAFAAYVEDKVAEKGGASEFLVYHAHGGILLPMIDGFVARPYPEGKEREAINAMFDNFVKTIKTKETERGVAMFAARNADIFSHKGEAWADREILARIERMEPIPVRPIMLTKKDAVTVFQKIGSATASDGLKIHLVSGAARKLFMHKDRRNLFPIITNIEKLIQASIPVYSEAPRKPDEHKNIIAFHNYVAKARLDERDMYVRFTVQEVKKEKPNELNNAALSDVEIMSAATDGNPSWIISQATIQRGGLDHKLLAWMRSVKEFGEKGGSFAARSADAARKMDADYFSAIERGDVEAVERIAEDAAKAAGAMLDVRDEYDEFGPVKVYSGSKNKGFTTFDKSRLGENSDTADATIGFFFTKNKGIAKKHFAGPDGEVRSFYIIGDKDLDVASVSMEEYESMLFGSQDEREKAGYDYREYKDGEKAKANFEEFLREQVQDKEIIRVEDPEFAPENPEFESGMFIVRNPSLIKSADPIVRDADGNIIPLSARFNPKVNDIRFAAKQDATPAPTVPDSWKPVEGDIVVGDTIRFSEAVFSGQHYNPKYEGNREVIAEVLKISAGDIQSENTISLRVVSSSGEQPIAEGTKTRRKRKNVFRNEVSRLTWENEQHRGELASTGDEATDYLREYLAGKTRFQAYVLDIFDRLGVEYSPRMRFGFPSYDYVYTDYGEIRIKDHKQPLGGGMNEGTRQQYGESAIDIYVHNGKINIVFNGGKEAITEWLRETESAETKTKFLNLFDALSKLDGKSSSLASSFIEKKVRELETTRSTARTPEDVLILQKGLEQGEEEGVKGEHEQRTGERWGDFASGEPGRIGGEHDLSDGSQREIAGGQAESIWGTGKGRLDAERIVEKAHQRDWGRKVVVDDSPEIREVMSSIRARAAALGANVVKARRDSIGTDGVYLGGGDILIATRNTASEINEATDHELIHFLDDKGDKEIRGLRRKINRTSRAWKGLRKWLRTNYRLNLLDSGMKEPEVQSWLVQNLTPEDVDKELVAELARPTTGPSEINLWEAFGPLQKQAEQDFAKLNERLYAGAAAQEGAVDSTTTADSSILAARPAWEGSTERRIREMVERGEYPDLRAEPYTMRNGKAAHKVVDQDGRSVRYGLTQAEANEFIIRRGAEIADMVGALAGQNPEHLEKSMKAYREMERLLSSTTVPRTEAVRRIISSMKDMGMLKYVDAKSIAPIMRQIANTETPLGVDRALYRADLFIRGRLAEAAGKKVMRDLKKLIETNLPKLQDNKTLTTKPKHLMYVAQWFKRAQEYMQMTPEEKNAAIEAIEAKLAMDMANTGEDMSEETADAVVDKMLLYTFGGLGESPGFNRAMAAYNAAKTLVDFGVDKYMAEENRKKAEAEAYRNKAIEETKAGREFDLNEDEFLRRDTPFKEWLTRLANHIHAKALGGRYLFDQAFDSRKGVEPMSGVMVGMYRRKNKAVADKYLLDEALMARLNDELLNVVGANPENSVEEAKKFHETWTDWKKQQENSGVFFRKIIYDDDGNIIRLEKTSEMRASKLEMLYYWLIAKRAQELAKQNFTNTPRDVEGGFNWLMLAMVKNRYTAETVAEMDKALPVGLKQLGRWMVDQIIESRPLVEKSTMALLGATPEMEGDWYFPVNKQNDRKGIATGGNNYTLVQSYMKVLTANTLDLRPSDPIQVFLNYFERLHHVATHVELVDMANRVIRHPDMQKTLRRYKGEAIQKAVNNDLDRLTIGGEGAVMSSLIERFQKGFARSVVPSIGQMPRQFTSSILLNLPRFHPPGTSFASNVVKAVKMMLNPSAIARFDQELNEDVPRWRERYQRGHSQSVRMAREKHGFNLNEKLSWFEALNFFPQAGDKLASLTGRSIYDNWYNYYLNDKKMAPEDAKRAAGDKFMLAVNESQQSGALPDLGDSQVGWAKWFMMFKSQDVALTRMWMEAVRNIAMRRGSVKDNVLTMLAVSVSQMLFQAVVDGFFIAAFDDPDEWKRFRNNQIRAALLAPINGYIVFPEAIGRLVTVLMGDKIYGDFAGDVVPWLSVVDSTIEIGEQLASDSQLTAENWWTIAQSAADVTGALVRKPVGPTVRLAKGMSDAITEDMPAAGRPLRFLGWSKQAAGQKRKKKPRRSGASKKPWDDDPW